MDTRSHKTLWRWLAAQGFFLVLVAVAFSSPAAAQGPATFTTVSGLPGVSGGSGFVMPALFAGVQNLCTDAVGNVWVADSGNNEIRMVTPSGVVHTVAGGQSGFAEGSGSSARFSDPEAICFDPQDGDLYVADLGNHAIRQVTPSGTVTTIATASATALCFDSNDGQLYGAGDETIMRIGFDGTVTVIAGRQYYSGSADGSGSDARFGIELSLCYDAGDHDLYVADTSNETVRRVTTSGAVTTIAGQVGTFGFDDGTGDRATLASPQGICYDAADDVMFCIGEGSVRRVTAAGVVGTASGGYQPADRACYDAAGGDLCLDEDFAIVQLDANGTTTVLAGCPGTPGSGDAVALYDSPKGISGDSAGNLYVADTLHQVIRKITPAGQVTVLAGTPGQAGATDGPGTKALFDDPSGICYDGADGNLYVADTVNGSVRRIGPDGAVGTVASGLGRPTGICYDPADGNLYVTDPFVGQIWCVSTSGSATALALSGDSVQAAPACICYDSDDHALYFTDGGAICRLSTSGVVTVLSGGSDLSGVCYDPPDHELVFSESSDRALREVNLTTGAVSLAYSNGSQAFSSPAGLFYSALDTAVYVADPGTQTIVRAVAVPGSSVAPTNYSLPAVSGTPAVGQTLDCSSGSWTGNPAPTFAYQWARNGQAIASATSASYTVQDFDRGYVLSCQVMAYNSAGEAGAVSAGVTVPGPASAPANTDAPNISGTVELTHELFCAVGTWTGSPSPTYSFQWQRDGQAIALATYASYAIQAADCGHTLTCQVTATNTAGHVSSTSNGVTVPASLAVQELQLTAPVPAQRQSFGSSVALHGNMALVGAPGMPTMNAAGAAYLFCRTATGWQLTATLHASDEADTDGFGSSVALDGDTALVGATSRTVDGAIRAGVVYVFTGSGAHWTQQAEFSDPQPTAGDDFGGALALAGDTAFVGAPAKDYGSGAVYPYQRSGTHWTQETALVTPQQFGLGFGGSLALSRDTVLIGASGSIVDGEPDAGRAFAYVRTGSGWAEQAELQPPYPMTFDFFGASVALSGDTAVVSAPCGAVDESPATFVFTRSGTAWSRRAEFAGLAGPVALDGDTALVGTTLFSGAGADWTLRTVFADPKAGSASGFGGCSALSGGTALIGAAANDPGGAAYVCRSATAPTFDSLSPTSARAGVQVTLSGTGLGDASAVAFNGAAANFTVISGTKIVATVPAGATSGPATVAVPCGTLTCVQDFTVLAAPPSPATIGLKLGGLKNGALKLGKRVSASGAATPASLAGALVTITVERSEHGKWHKVGAVTATIARGGRYSRSYRPAKRGVYRLRASIAATRATTAAATTWRKFTVK